MIKYGGYVEYKDGCKEEAKERLRKELHDFIDELCDKEEFWIVKEPFKNGDPISVNTIGWRIDIPHMENAPKD